METFYFPKLPLHWITLLDAQNAFQSRLEDFDGVAQFIGTDNFELYTDCNNLPSFWKSCGWWSLLVTPALKLLWLTCPKTPFPVLHCVYKPLVMKSRIQIQGKIQPPTGHPGNSLDKGTVEWEAPCMHERAGIRAGNGYYTLASLPAGGWQIYFTINFKKQRWV